MAEDGCNRHRCSFNELSLLESTTGFYVHVERSSQVLRGRLCVVVSDGCKLRGRGRARGGSEPCVKSSSMEGMRNAEYLK